VPRYLLVSVGGLLVLIGCAGEAQTPRPQGPTDVVATLGGSTITLAEVDERALKQSADTFGNSKLAQALYLARRAALDEIIGNRLIDQEARTRGVDRPTLVEQEIADKAPAPTDAEVKAWYDANASRVQGATLDQVRSPIRSLLIQQRMQASRDRFVEELKKRTAVTIRLEPPRESVSTAGRPSRGPADAPIVMIEFSDFQCPFCLRAHPTVEQVLKAYGDRIHFVYRHYPLPNHPNARPAAEASACANEQGKFWPYYDRLFADASKLADGDLKQHAARIGLDTARFDACFDSHKYRQDVETDISDGNAAGVAGTPAFFINGRALEGAQPFEAFKRIIDEELALKGW
jgi:protein-disulfide isomerase